MAGQLTIDTLKASTGVLATQNGMTGIAKAWINYNGSTQAIRSSFNVSSVTFTGTGDYTLNFTTAMPSTNFCAVVTSTGPVNTAHTVPFLGAPGSDDTSGFPSTSQFRFSHYVTTNSGARGNPVVTCVAIFAS